MGAADGVKAAAGLFPLSLWKGFSTGGQLIAPFGACLDPVDHHAWYNALGTMSYPYPTIVVLLSVAFFQRHVS